MFGALKSPKLDIPLVIGIVFLVGCSILILSSVYPEIFPQYFYYIAFGFFLFFMVSKIDFDILILFSNHLYTISIVFLIIPLLIGQVTRGAVRWIPLGSFSIQPTEIVRPFIILFFANYLIGKKIDMTIFSKALLLLALPIFLILIQPSLGVSILTTVSFFGVLIASQVNKKYIFFLFGTVILLMPVLYNFIAPYQKQRIMTFLSPQSDPFGSGYNSIQSTIAVGSGQIVGKGLGRGVQTQLNFLPESQTDFIFASISEELGFLGAVLVLSGSFFILFRLTQFMKNAESPYARAYLSGVVLVMFVQITTNIGMNIGLMPITGLPLPLVSAGGSSFLATMISLGIAVRCRK